MDLRHVEQVLEICRTGSFSGAARRLGISQPTLSKSIARLEAELALKLFERNKGAAQPTEYGALIAKRAESMLIGMETLRRELDSVARGESGHLRILSGTVARLKPLPALVRLARARFPGLQIETSVAADRWTMMQALTTGRYDLVLGTSNLAADHQELIRVHLYDDEVVAAVRPGHPALAEQPLTPARLLSYKLAVPTGSAAFRRWTSDLSPGDADHVRPLQTDDYDIIKQHALLYDYVALGVRFVYADELDAGKLVELRLTETLPYECWMLTTPERWQSPLVRAVAELAKLAVNERPR
jgi:DNA-binding transcriptional LysR family regulator